jgi:RNA polymerase sigma-70 factor (ECF subfamily)
MSQTAIPEPDTTLDTPDEAGLVAKAQRDPRALAPLYRRYVGAVYRYCYLRLGEASDAEDATSEAFAKALVGLPGYRDDHFAEWLIRIVHNTVCDTYRRPRPGARAAATGDRADPALTPEDWVLAQDGLAAVRTALGVLPMNQRRAV